MPSGIRATIEFTASGLCPVVAISEAAGTRIDSVARSVAPPDCAGSVTEFSVPAADVPDAAHVADGDVTPVFSHGSTRRYRYVHDEGVDCPCECLGQYGCPVARYVAREGRLTLVFHAADYDELRDAVADLRERFPDADVTRLVRAPAGEESPDDVLVDRGKLTARQLDVLETAYEMGYFERPRRANGTEVAAELGISPSTFAEHLSAAESKILGDLL